MAKTVETITKLQEFLCHHQIALANVGFAWVLKPAKAENLCVHFAPLKSRVARRCPHVYTVLTAGWKTLRVSVWGAVRGSMRKLRHKGSVLKGVHTQFCVPVMCLLNRPKVTVLLSGRASWTPSSSLPKCTCLTIPPGQYRWLPGTVSL